MHQSPTKSPSSITGDLKASIVSSVCSSHIKKVEHTARHRLELQKNKIPCKNYTMYGINGDIYKTKTIQQFSCTESPIYTLHHFITQDFLVIYHNFFNLS